MNKFLAFGIVILLSGSVAAQEGRDDKRTLMVFFDGLRPDYITSQGMPRLYAFKQKASYGTKHHSVFPTVTRVNSSSYSTGSYPETHGLMGNTVYFPEVDKINGLNTGEASDLKRIDSATKGNVLTTKASLGQVLAAAGKKMMVFSSGSTGQALLQNHSMSGGITVNPAMILPESFKARITKDIGAPPIGGKTDVAGHAWITDALLLYGFVDNGPIVNAIWYSEPDGAAHKYGIGSPEAVAALKIVDTQFGRILDSLVARKLEDKVNIMISTDHGFASYVGKQGLSDFLVKQGLKRDKSSDDVIVVEGAIYVKSHDRAITQKIVSALQSQEWVGPIFTKSRSAGDNKGIIDGTFSFESVHWNHPTRAADILTASNWDDRKNKHGYAGASFSTGVAGHGGLSPYEVHIALMAHGPDFKNGYTDDLPTSNVDIVPTVLHLHKLPVPAAMEGRVLFELLKETTSSVPKAIVEVTETSSGNYKMQLTRTILGKYTYIDFAKIYRTKR